MSKKHFELLARNISLISDPSARRIAAIAVAQTCLQFNSRFDPDRFLTACGVSV